MPIPHTIEIEMRGGSHPDEEMDAVEHSIAEIAHQRMLTDPKWAELGYKKAYNLSHFFTFWMTRNPNLIKLLYRLQPYPQYLEMEANQGCPLNCVMCETTYWDEPTEILSWKNFRKIADQFPELKWMGINAIGEPNINKNYFKMLKWFSQRGVCQEQYTTGALIEPKDFEKYVKMGFEFVKFSMDAATPETWKKIRPKCDWNHTMDCVEALDYYKRKHGRAWPEIQFHYLLMKQSIGEALDFLDVVNSLDVDVSNVYFSKLLHSFKEIEKNTYTEVPPELIEKLRAKGKKLGITVTFSQDIPERWPPINECVAWWMPYIFCDGTVISCCCMNLQNRRAWQRKTALGNALKTPMREIWEGEKYRRLRNQLWLKKPRGAHPVCGMCNIYNVNKLSDIGEGCEWQKKR